MNFTNDDATKLLEIIKSRRDVRGNHFISKPVEDEKLSLILEAGLSAPSVGYSQPWEFVVITNKDIKQKVIKNFQKENEKAKEIFKDKELYKNLKLEGIEKTPINIAIIYNKPNKDILGMTSMQKMGEYSVVCAVQNMWLMARALNIGIGWVSILDEKQLLKDINKDENSTLVAYLCVGYVDTFLKEPELKTLGWEDKKEKNSVIDFLI